MTHQHNVVMWNSAAVQWHELVAISLNNIPFVPIFSTLNFGMVIDAATENEWGAAIVVFPSGCWKAASFAMGRFDFIHDMVAMALSLGTHQLGTC